MCLLVIFLCFIGLPDWIKKKNQNFQVHDLISFVTTLGISQDKYYPCFKGEKTEAQESCMF